MSGSSRLGGGLTRVFEDHRSTLAREYRGEHLALLRSLAITDPVLIRECARVAFLVVRAREAGRAWAAAVEGRHRRRAKGTGKAPSLIMIERARKAMALEDLTAAGALDRLRALVGDKPKPSPAELVRQAQEAMRGAGDDDDA